MIRTVFMGTPSFACEQLRALVENGAEAGISVVGVLTQPDKPNSRGNRMIPCETKVFAEAAGLPVYQPKTLRDEAFSALLRELDPELIVVAAYGKILPKSVLEYPRYGCINVHGSLLPRYRGAAPIQRAMMDGERVTGVTVMYMEEGLDTGAMLAKCEVEIRDDENFGSLYERMARAGSSLLLSVLPRLFDGTAVAQPQDDSASTYAEKIDKSEYLLDFTEDAAVLCRKIRALAPAPCAYAFLERDGGKKRIKFTAAARHPGAVPPSEAGTVIAAEKDCITVAAGDGALDLYSLIPEGKKEMPAADFIRGRQVAPGDRFVRE